MCLEAHAPAEPSLRAQGTGTQATPPKGVSPAPCLLGEEGHHWEAPLPLHIGQELPCQSKGEVQRRPDHGDKGQKPQAQEALAQEAWRARRPTWPGLFPEPLARPAQAWCDSLNGTGGRVRPAEERTASAGRENQPRQQQVATQMGPGCTSEPEADPLSTKTEVSAHPCHSRNRPRGRKGTVINKHGPDLRSQTPRQPAAGTASPSSAEILHSRTKSEPGRWEPALRRRPRPGAASPGPSAAKRLFRRRATAGRSPPYFLRHQR